MLGVGWAADSHVGWAADSVGWLWIQKRRAEESMSRIWTHTGSDIAACDVTGSNIAAYDATGSNIGRAARSPFPRRGTGIGQKPSKTWGDPFSERE